MAKRKDAKQAKIAAQAKVKSEEKAAAARKSTTQNPSYKGGASSVAAQKSVKKASAQKPK